jgi:dTDP-glucose pyrophosphorylase
LIDDLQDLKNIAIGLNDSIQSIIFCIEQSGDVGCALLYGDSGEFINLFTDGDVRRAFLCGLGLKSQAHEVLKVKSRCNRVGPIVASIYSSHEERIELFKKFNLRQLVLMNGANPTVIISSENIDWRPHYIGQNFSALIMAGGFGTRLMPLTTNTPKPMLKINGQPILEIIIKKLVHHGVNRISISTHYLPEVIRNYFNDGEDFGVAIDYVYEETPLGTGGALALIKNPSKSTLVINGDILTELNIEMLLASHLKNDAAMTIATTQYQFQVPFGVISEKDGAVIRVEEKPTYSFSVNSGIYFIDDQVFECLPKGPHFNMTDLADLLIQRQNKVQCFPIFEHWLDVGRHDDFRFAETLFTNKSKVQILN